MLYFDCCKGNFFLIEVYVFLVVFVFMKVQRCFWMCRRHRLRHRAVAPVRSPGDPLPLRRPSASPVWSRGCGGPSPPSTPR